MLTLSEELFPKIRAAMAGLWVQTWEIEEAESEIRRLCTAQQWALASWDSASGLRDYSAPATENNAKAMKETSYSAALLYLLTKLGNPENNQTRTRAPKVQGEAPIAILLIKNGHLIMNSAGNIQQTANVVWTAKHVRKYVIILSHSTAMPPELEKIFTLVDHSLPDKEQLERIAKSLCESEEELGKTPEEVDAVLNAASGMTRMEAENAFSLSIISQQKMEPETIFKLKAQMLRKGNQALRLHRGKESFADIGGMKHLKEFCTSVLKQSHTNPKFRARGIITMGVSGTGKSLFAKALGNEVGRPTLLCDLGATRGSLQGQTEAWTKEMLQKVDAMAPCLLLIDEIEKAMAGASGSSRTDAGVSARQLGTLLSWLQDHTSDVFVIATANDATKIIDDCPELIRAGRFDGLFFSDFPDARVRDAIWRIHLKEYEMPWPVNVDLGLPQDKFWTGAEIEACCRLSRLQGKTVAEFGKCMPTLADQAEETIARARKWADKRCWSTEEAALYQAEKHTHDLGLDEQRRKLTREEGKRPAVHDN